MSAVFISHSSKDRKVAETICNALEQRGIVCWIASRDVGPGENFGTSIYRAIRAAKVMVLVFSNNANLAPDEIAKELVLASQNKLVVIPARVEDVLPNEQLGYELAARHWIDLFEDWERAIERLGAQITRVAAAESDAARGEAAAVTRPESDLRSADDDARPDGEQKEQGRSEQEARTEELQRKEAEARERAETARRQKERESRARPQTMPSTNTDALHRIGILLIAQGAFQTLTAIIYTIYRFQTYGSDAGLILYSILCTVPIWIGLGVHAGRSQFKGPAITVCIVNFLFDALIFGATSYALVQGIGRSGLQTYFAVYVNFAGVVQVASACTGLIVFAVALRGLRWHPPADDQSTPRSFAKKGLMIAGGLVLLLIIVLMLLGLL